MDQRTGAKAHLRNLYNSAFGVSLRCIRFFPGRAGKQNRISIHLKRRHHVDIDQSATETSKATISSLMNAVIYVAERHVCLCAM